MIFYDEEVGGDTDDDDDYYDDDYDAPWGRNSNHLNPDKSTNPLLVEHIHILFIGALSIIWSNESMQIYCWFNVKLGSNR